MDPEDMTSEQVWALVRNPKFRELLSPEDRAELEAKELAYLRACSAEEFAAAAAETAARQVYAAVVRLVAAARRDPAALDDPAVELPPAFRERVRRLVEEGEEVTTEVVEELGRLFGPREAR